MQYVMLMVVENCTDLLLLRSSWTATLRRTEALHTLSLHTASYQFYFISTVTHIISIPFFFIHDWRQFGKVSKCEIKSGVKGDLKRRSYPETSFGSCVTAVFRNLQDSRQSVDHSVICLNACSIHLCHVYKPLDTR